MTPEEKIEPVDKTRIQIDLFAKEMERMSWIMYVCDLATRKDLFNTALTMLFWAVNEVRAGREIASIGKSDNGDIKVLSMAALDSAAMAATSSAASQAERDTLGRPSGPVGTQDKPAKGARAVFASKGVSALALGDRERTVTR